MRAYELAASRGSPLLPALAGCSKASRFSWGREESPIVRSGHVRHRDEVTS